MTRAEQKAGLPKLERGLWHAFRRAYASDRKHLPDMDVTASAGGRDVSTMKRAYQRPDPATVLWAIENAPTPDPGHTADTLPNTKACTATL